MIERMRELKPLVACFNGKGGPCGGGGMDGLGLEGWCDLMSSVAGLVHVHISLIPRPI